MPASSIAPENNEAQEYQRALEDATFAVEEISSNIDDFWKLILVTENKIDELKEELVLAQNNIAELRKDLFLARKKVAGIKNDCRTVESGNVVADETIVPRLVSKIKEVLRMIDELEKLGFVLPVTIGMGLEILIALPENASSQMAASAYHQNKRNIIITRSHFDSRRPAMTCIGRIAALDAIIKRAEAIKKRSGAIIKRAGAIKKRRLEIFHEENLLSLIHISEPTRPY